MVFSPCWVFPFNFCLFCFCILFLSPFLVVLYCSFCCFFFSLKTTSEHTISEQDLIEVDLFLKMIVLRFILIQMNLFYLDCEISSIMNTDTCLQLFVVLPYLIIPHSGETLLMCCFNVCITTQFIVNQTHCSTIKI